MAVAVTEKKETPEKPEIKESLIEQLAELSDAEINRYFEIISKLYRAVTGKEITPENAITKLIDVKEILERSYFPARPEVDFQVYARLLSKSHPDVCEDWEIFADLRAKALKSLDGFSSNLYVEMFKAQNVGVQPTSATSISFGSQAQAQKQSRLKFWKRSKETEQ